MAVLTSVLILLKLDSSRESYIIEYRPSLGIAGYDKGSGLDLISFAVFALMVLVFHVFMSAKVYPARHHFAIVILGMGTILIVLSLVMSNALLLLR